MPSSFQRLAPFLDDSTARAAALGFDKRGLGLAAARFPVGGADADGVGDVGAVVADGSAPPTDGLPAADAPSALARLSAPFASSAPRSRSSAPTTAMITSSTRHAATTARPFRPVTPAESR